MTKETILKFPHSFSSGISKNVFSLWLWIKGMCAQYSSRTEFKNSYHLMPLGWQILNNNNNNTGNNNLMRMQENWKPLDPPGRSQTQWSSLPLPLVLSFPPNFFPSPIPADHSAVFCFCFCFFLTWDAKGIMSLLLRNYILTLDFTGQLSPPTYAVKLQCRLEWRLIDRLWIAAILFWKHFWWGFPVGSDGKDSTCSSGDLHLIPGSERAPGEGNGNPLQCSCLGNPMNRGAWRAAVHGVTKESDTTEQLTPFFFFFIGDWPGG